MNTGTNTRKQKKEKTTSDLAYDRFCDIVREDVIESEDLDSLNATVLMPKGPKRAQSSYMFFCAEKREELKEEVMSDMKGILSNVDKSGEGVYVQASTLGSLEALLSFLESDAVRIPVSGISIGPVHKRDVMGASVMLERKKKVRVCVRACVCVWVSSYSHPPPTTHPHTDLVGCPGRPSGR